MADNRRKKRLKARWDERPDVDCVTCYRRADCDRAAENSFCSMWQSAEPEARGEDPNAGWLRGEDVNF